MLQRQSGNHIFNDQPWILGEHFTARFTDHSNSERNKKLAQNRQSYNELSKHKTNI